MNDESVPGDAIADAPEPVARLLRAAQGPPAPGETQGHDAMLAAFGLGATPAPAVTDAVVAPIAAARARRWVVAGSVAATLAVCGVGAAAAVQGSLPAPLQRAVSSVAERVGIDLPLPDAAPAPGIVTPTTGSTTPSGVRPPGLNEQPENSSPPISTPSGVRPDDQQVAGWCRAWTNGSGNGESMDAGSRQALIDEALDRSTEVVALCASLGIGPPIDTATTVRPPNPNQPTSPPGQTNGDQPNDTRPDTGDNGKNP